MAIRSGLPDAESPTANEELDATPVDDESTSSDPSAEADDASPAPEAVESPKRDPKAEADEALQAAIEHLTKPDEKTPDEDIPAGDKPVDPPKDKVDPKAKPDEKKPDEDPFADWTPEERASIKSKAANRFKAVYDRARKAETNLADLNTVVEKAQVPRDKLETILSTGKAWNEVLDAHKVRDELQYCEDGQIAGLIKTQASATRVAAAMDKGQAPSDADLEILSKVQGNLEGVLERAGRGRAPTQTDIPEWKEALPKPIQELVDMEMLSAEDGKLLASVKAMQAKAAEKPAPKPAQPVQQPAQTTTRSPARSLAPSTPAGPGPDVVTANKLIVRDLVDAGIKPEAAADHFTKNLVPLIERMVKEDLGPQSQITDVPAPIRPEYARRAQKEFTASRKPKAQPVTPTQSRPLDGTKARTPAGQAAESDLDAAISFLSNP